jgi:tetratricopeptide (TPR) repeat protein
MPSSASISSLSELVKSALDAMKQPRVVASMVRGLLCAVLLVTVGCASKTPRKPSQGQLQIEVAESARSVMDPDLSKVSSALHSFMVGQLAFEREDFKVAKANLSRAGELANRAVPKINIPLAELKLKAGDLAGALLEVQKAQEKDPHNVSLRLLKAGILDALGREQEAASEYLVLAADEEAPQDATYLAAAIYGKQARYQEGIELLERFLKKDPRNNLAQYLLGLLQENSGLLARAGRQYAQVVKRTPSNISVQFDRLRVLLKAGERDKAAALAREMLESSQAAGGVFGVELLREVQNPRVASQDLLKAVGVFATDEIRLSDLRLKLALVNVQEQQFSAALREFSVIVAKEPQNSVARYYRASLYGGAGRRKEAYEDLFAIRPEQELFVKSRMFAAFLKKQERDFKGAERAVREALAAAPGDDALFSYLIMVLREGRQYERALGIVNERLGKDANNERLLFNKGILLSDLNRASEARAIMEQVIALNDRNGDALNFVAYYLAESSKELDRAEKLAQRAIELSPRDGFYLDTLGWIYFNRQEYQRAAETLRKAHQLSGGDIVVSEHLGDALVKTGDLAEAAEIYRLALEKGRDEDPAERSTEVAEALPRLEDKLSSLYEQHPELSPSHGLTRDIVP